VRASNRGITAEYASSRLCCAFHFRQTFKPGLVRAAPDQIDLAREELDTLLERQLVELEQIASGCSRPRLTGDGHAVLQAVTRQR
jgi:hypothetical protein